MIQNLSSLFHKGSLEMSLFRETSLHDVVHDSHSHVLQGC